MFESGEELIAVIEQVKECDDSPEEILLSLNNLFDSCARIKKPIIASAIYNYIMEVEE